MHVREINLIDIMTISDDYILYFNKYEESEWTEELVLRKFKQLIERYDYLGIGLYENDKMIGFAVGNLLQFDDGIISMLNELFVIKEYQSKGYGTYLLHEFEKLSKSKFAFRIQLESANDDIHHRFYNKKNEFKNASNNILKSKAL